MACFINILLSLSISGAFLTLILILLKPLYKKRASQKWQYYIWLVVIIRLLFPFTINFNITVNTKQAEDYFPETLLIENTKGTEQLKNIQEINTSYGKENTAGNRDKQINTLWILEKLWVFTRQNLFYIWLIIAIAIFIRKVTVYQSFNKYLKAGSSEINSLNIWEITGILVEKYHIKTNIDIYINNMVSSPLLTGFFRPCIILPSEKLEETDLHNIISHELTHFKRKDMFYKWLVQFTACIHWFNPFMYLVIHETNKLCELSCDEAIIKNLDSKERKEYGNTLLHIAGSRKKLKTPGISVTLNEGWQLLK